MTTRQQLILISLAGICLTIALALQQAQINNLFKLHGEIIDAFQESSAAEVPIREAPNYSEAMDERDAERKETSETEVNQGAFQ